MLIRVKVWSRELKLEEEDVWGTQQTAENVKKKKKINTAKQQKVFRR